METFTLLSEAVTPEVAVLLRAALIAAFVFGLEALGKARRVQRYERKEVRQAGRTRGKQLSKKRIVRA